MNQEIKKTRTKEFKEINTKLNHLENLNYGELKHLYNELYASKNAYLNYLTKLEINQNKLTRFIKLILIGMGTIAIAWLVVHNTPIWINLIGLALILSAGYNCLSKDITPDKNQILNTYQNSLNKVNNLILEKEKELTQTRYGYTLSSVFPTPEIQEKAMQTVRDINAKDLQEKQDLTLKRTLTKK